MAPPSSTAEPGGATGATPPADTSGSTPSPQ
jgi:hypothetical protein